MIPLSRTLRTVLTSSTPSSLAYTLMYAAAAVALSACGDPTSPNDPPSKGDAHVRVINALFQGDSMTAVARPIDYLIDASTSSPGVAALAANGITTGDSSNGYRTLTPSLHSFMARLAGDTTDGAYVYTTTTNLPWVPRKQIVANSYTTILVAGIIPSAGAIPNNSVPITLLTDDRFPPPKLSGVYQARFTLIHAAVFADAGGTAEYGRVDMYVTPGTVPPVGPITDYASQGGYIYFRRQSSYVNVDAGSYVITIASQGNVIAQQAVTFSEGEVCTIVLQSTAPSETPSVANHKLTVLVDHRYAQ